MVFKQDEQIETTSQGHGHLCLVNFHFLKFIVSTFVVPSTVL